MATIGAVIGYKSGLTGVPLILTGGIFGGVMAVLMPALAQPVVRRITGSDDVALGHFCTIGYLVQAAVAKVVGKGSRSTEDLELPDNFKFLQDTYLAMAVVMVPMYLIPAIAAGPQYIAQFSGGINYLMYAFMQSIQFVAGSLSSIAACVYYSMSWCRLFAVSRCVLSRMQSPLSIARCYFPMRRMR